MYFNCIRNKILCILPLLVCLLFGSCDCVMGPTWRTSCPTSINLKTSKLTLFEGRQGVVSIREDVGRCYIRWSTSAYSIIELWEDSGGGATVVAKNAGEAVVTATPTWPKSDGLSTSCQVTVLPVSVHRMTLAPETLTVVENSQVIYVLEASFFDSVGVALHRSVSTWASSDSSIAKMCWSDGPFGHIRGFKVGEATIIASFENLSATALVRVVPQ
jgi:hypothetical protein